MCLVFVCSCCEKLFGNKKADNYTQLVEGLFFHFNGFDCNMIVEFHYLHRHLDRFPENLGDLSEGKGEIFHQDIKTMETRYQGRWNVHIMSDCCWNLIRDCPGGSHSRMSYKRSFFSCRMIREFVS
jgi:hypothetical protein